MNPDEPKDKYEEISVEEDWPDAKKAWWVHAKMKTEI